MLTGVIDDIRGQIGRNVSFYVPTLSGCSLCTLDPVTNTSTDSLCSGCQGKYWIPTYVSTTITGHITWGNIDELNWLPAGKVFDGDCRIQVKYTLNISSLIDDAEYLVADNKTLEVKSKVLRGVPTINRILLDCIEKEKTG